MALGTIAAIGGIASGVSSLLGGRKAKKQANRAAAEQRYMAQKNVDLIAAETEETLRRFDTEVEKVTSSSEAMIAASGFSSGSSQDIYLEAMTEEFADDRAWTVRSSQQRQEMAKLTGQYQAESLESQGKSAYYQGIGGMFSGLTTAAAHTDWGK